MRAFSLERGFSFPDGQDTATQAPHSVQMPGYMISRLSLPNDMSSLSFSDCLTLITLLSSSLNFFSQF
jgi:hypothetical protein